MDIRKIAKEMANSYKDSDITMFSCRQLPDKAEIISILEDIQSLFFPAYFSKAECFEPCEFSEQLLSSVYYRLKKQIELALSFDSQEDVKEKAERVTEGFISSLPCVHKLLIKDVHATYEGDPAATSLEEIIFSYPGFYAILVYRIAHLLYLSRVPFIPRIMSEYAHGKTGVDINPGATIGEYFFIDHGTGIVIGETTVIGDHVKIYQGVTLGAKSFELDENGNPVKGIKRHPDIGDGCIIYANATILGGNTRIGRGAVIGGNVWLTHSVEDGAVVYYNQNNPG